MTAVPESLLPLVLPERGVCNDPDFGVTDEKCEDSEHQWCPEVLEDLIFWEDKVRQTKHEICIQQVLK